MGTKPVVVTEEEDTVPTEVPETPDSKILEMASAVLTGTIWTADEADISEFQTKFSVFLKGMQGIGKEFDRQLKGAREANGADFLKSVKYNRKPREKASNTSLLDALKL